MDDVLSRIKRAVMAGRVVFTEKAADELERDHLTELDVAEAIWSAPAISKKIRSNRRATAGEPTYLFVIQGLTLDGVLIYTKGRWQQIGGIEYFYLLVSSKRSVA